METATQVPPVVPAQSTVHPLETQPSAQPLVTAPAGVKSCESPRPIVGLGLAAKANVALGTATKLPPGMTFFNTKDLSTGYFHGMLYSETSARKSTTAAKFGTAENVLIVLCRQREQLIPLRDLGYQVCHVETGAALRYALNYPEKIAEAMGFQTWLDSVEKTIVLDDVTEAVGLLLEDNSTNETTGKEFKDMRKVYGEAGKDLRELTKSLRRKPMHLVLIALAKVSVKPLTHEETIAPDLPPSMMGMLTTELEFVFFIKKSNWKMITDTTFLNYKDTDEHGKTQVYRREIFAKHKLPLNLVGKGVVRPEEDLDLAALWLRIKEGKPVAPAGK